MVEREHATRKDEAELMVVAERKKKAGAGRERSSKPSATMRLLRASERRARARVEERKWQRGQRRTRPGAPGDQGVSKLPHGSTGAAVRTRGRGAGAGAGVGKGVSAGGLGRLRLVGQK